jgi:hypothetical protein
MCTVAILGRASGVGTLLVAMLSMWFIMQVHELLRYLPATLRGGGVDSLTVGNNLPPYHSETECVFTAQCTPLANRRHGLIFGQTCRMISWMCLVATLASVCVEASQPAYVQVWYVSSAAILLLVQTVANPTTDRPALFHALSWAHGTSEHLIGMHLMFGEFACAHVVLACATTYAVLLAVSRAQGPCAHFLRTAFAFVEAGHFTMFLGVLFGGARAAASPLAAHASIHISAEVLSALKLHHKDEPAIPVVVGVYVLSTARAFGALAARA